MLSSIVGTGMVDGVYTGSINSGSGMTINLSATGTLYWHVQAFDIFSQTGAWSSIESFNIMDALPAPTNIHLNPISNYPNIVNFHTQS